MHSTHQCNDTWSVSRRKSIKDTGSSFNRQRRFWVYFSVANIAIALLVFGFPDIASADTEELEGVLDGLRLWIVGIAGTIVAVMLTIAGVRYLLASDPGETEKAKTALRAAAIGFAIVLLAPIFVAILSGILE